MMTNMNCTVYRTMDFVGKRWTLLILLEIHKGKDETRRFSEIRRKIPDITPKMLSERLRELEAEGLISHFVDDTEVPIKSTYKLTESGHEFVQIISSIKAWSLKHKVHNPVCAGTDCRDCVL